MKIDAKTKLCCIIGDPVEHSVSPIMHNAGYEALGLNYVYVAFHVASNNLQKAIVGLRSLQIRGIIVTIPHKIEVMKYIDEVDDTAKAIGAVNTIVNDEGILKGTNTDWVGSTKALKEHTNITDKRVAVLGAGGASRAVCYGLKKEGALVSVFNRTVSNAVDLAHQLDLDGGYSLGEVDKIKQSDIIVNTTSVGMQPKDTLSPLPDGAIQKYQVVFDIVYTPLKTRLIHQAEQVGATVVYGDDMILYGGIGQFELFTDNKAPIEEMRQTVYQLTRKSF